MLTNILSGFLNICVLYEIVLHGLKYLILTLQGSELWTS